MLSIKNNFLFIHVPKTGGNSIQLVLEKYSDDKIVDYDENMDTFEITNETFKNLHKLCKIGGYMIHHIPPVGYWLDHGPVHYKDDFFRKLAERNSYEITYYKYVDSSQLISCILRKNNDYFIEKDNFPFEEIEWEEEAPLKGNYRVKK